MHKKMFEIHPKNVESFYALALAYFNSGHFDNSMKWIQKFLSKADGSKHSEEIKWASFALAACYYYMDNKGEAINQYNVAKQDYPTSYYVDMFSFILGKPFEIVDMSVIVDGKSRIVYKPSEVVHITGKSDLSLLIELEPNITDSFNVDVRLFYNDKIISKSSTMERIYNKLCACGYEGTINEMAIAIENGGREFQFMFKLMTDVLGLTDTKNQFLYYVHNNIGSQDIIASKNVDLSKISRFTIDCIKYTKSCNSYSGKYRFEVWSNGFLIGSETYDLVAD